MRPEILENVLYYYIEEKTGFDDVDSPLPKSTDFISSELDSTFQFSNLTEQSYANSPEVLLHSPVVFMHEPLDSVQRDKAAEAGKKLVKLSEEFAAGQPKKCPVKFKTSCLFVTQKKQTVSISVVRSPGFTDEPLKVLWKTCDKTALAGIHYTASTGELKFDKGVMERDIQCDILSFTNSPGDLRFKIELSVPNSVFVPTSITLALENIDNLNQEERNVSDHLLSASPSTVKEVNAILNSCLTNHSFHSALSYVCSKADSVPLEFSLAFELSWLCLNHLPFKTVFKVLRDFFRADDLELEGI